MSAAARDIVFTRHRGSRGLGWLKESYAMFRTARLAWILLLMTYYLMLLFADFIPFIGGLAAPLLKPVFAVGFLAAAWTQERGGAPGRDRTYGKPSGGACQLAVDSWLVRVGVFLRRAPPYARGDTHRAGGSGARRPRVRACVDAAVYVVLRSNAAHLGLRELPRRF